jgi:myosin heavy subunit
MCAMANLCLSNNLTTSASCPNRQDTFLFLKASWQSVMSESEGLAKLTEYLKQTRRQAETAIDNLNQQLNEAQKDNTDLKKQIKQLEHEKAEYKKLAEQIKQDTSNKNKFKERDDWKHLVDSIEQDRTRLQAENLSLQAILSTMSDTIEDFKREVSKLRNEKKELSEIVEDLRKQLDAALLTASIPTSMEGNARQKSFRSNGENVSLSLEDGETGGLSVSPSHRDPQNAVSDGNLLSPVIDKSTGKEIFSFEQLTPTSASSPHAIARKLKDALLKAHSQVIFHSFTLILSFLSVLIN